MEVIPINKKKIEKIADSNIVKFLEEALEEAKKGEIDAFLMFTRAAEDGQWFMTNAGVLSVTEVLGTLEVFKLDIIEDCRE